MLLLPLAAGCHKTAQENSAQNNGPKHLLVPETGAYTGAYIDFGDTEDSVTFDAIDRFQKLVGKHQAIVASSSYWGKKTFPRTNLEIISEYGAIPLVYWSPWCAPYQQYVDDGTKTPAQYMQNNPCSLTAILAGKWDAYIDMWAEQAKAYHKPFFVSLMNEANGNWFPWSGYFYGADTKIQTPEGTRYQGPETFKKAYRYIVSRVRAKGATNIIWVFHIEDFSIPWQSWNAAKEYYPGAKYVDWIGMSLYGKQTADDNWSPIIPGEIKGKKVKGLFSPSYYDLSQIDPSKPLMLCEWSVGEFPSAGNKARWIKNCFAKMKTHPRIKAAIYWDERWQNNDNDTENGDYSNLRVNSDPEALDAYRAGIADPHWLDKPIWDSGSR